MKNNSGTALITGGAKRLGKAFALALAQKGWNIILHYHTSCKEAYLVKQEIETYGAMCFLVKADLRNIEEVMSLFKKLPLEYLPNLLINNAALFEKDTAFSATIQSWDDHMAINVRAPFFLMQQFFAYLPTLIQGNIVNIVDYSVTSVADNFTSYNISKLSLWHLTQHLALAFAPKARVNAIGLSALLPNDRQSSAHFHAMQTTSPLQTGPDIHALGTTLDYILASHSMTGQLLLLDGGLHLKTTPYG